MTLGQLFAEIKNLPRYLEVSVKHPPFSGKWYELEYLNVYIYPEYDGSTIKTDDSLISIQLNGVFRTYHSDTKVKVRYMVDNEADKMSQHNSIDLIEQYKQLMQKQRSGSFTKNDALDLVVICTELGKRGYKLMEDESNWIKPVKPITDSE